MKKQMLLGVLGVLAMGLTACGGVPTSVATPANEEPVGVASAWRYMQNGQALSSEAVKALEAKQGQLFFLADTDGSGTVAQVFTQKADFERAKGLQSQGFCVSTRTRTTVYDHINFGGDRLELSKGTQVADLGSLFQADGEDWDNDISSFKGADCVYTYMYTGVGFTGSVLATKSAELNMGGWDQLISSIIVGT